MQVLEKTKHLYFGFKFTEGLLFWVFACQPNFIDVLPNFDVEVEL